MSDSKEQDNINTAGQPIFELANQRYHKSAKSWSLLASILGFTFVSLLLFLLLDDIELTFADNFIFRILAIIAGISIIIGIKFWRRAGNAQKGAIEEREVGEILKAHCKAIKHNVQIPFYGDIDNVIETKESINYVVDVKSYPARVYKDSKGFFHLSDSQHSLVLKVNGQAYEMAKLTSTNGENIFYKAILCFSELNIDKLYIYQKVVNKNGKIKAAYITSKDKICDMLDYLDEANRAR